MAEELEKKDIIKNEISTFLKRCDEKGNTLLHYVVKSDNEELARQLIASGCDVRKRNNQNDPPLVVAIHENKLRMVEILLKAGADYDNRHFTFKEGPLHIAAKNGCPEIVQLLLDMGADVNAQNERKETVLHCATLAVDNTIVTSLTEKEMDNFYRIIEILITAGAEMNTTDRDCRTPLLNVVEFGWSAGFELLLHMGADIRINGVLDYRILHRAVFASNLDMVKRLVELGYDMNMADDDGFSCLHVTAAYSESEIMEYLLSNGTPINNVNINWDPLCYALDEWADRYMFYSENDDRDQEIETEDDYNQEMYIKQMKCLDLFIKYGANFNNVTYQGETALYIVLKNYECFHSNFVRVLLKNGSKLDFDHPSVRQLFANSEHSKFPHLLLRHTAKFEAQNRSDGPTNFDLSKLNEKWQKDYARCRDELESMKSIKIDETNVSFFDVLVNQEIGPYTRNEQIRNVFESQYVSRKFPIYSDLLCERFAKEVEHQKLVDEAANGLGYVLNWDMNIMHLPFRNILSYLDDKDFTNLALI